MVNMQASAREGSKRSPVNVHHGSIECNKELNCKRKFRVCRASVVNRLGPEVRR